LQAHFNAALPLFSLFFTLFLRTASQVGSVYFIFASPVQPGSFAALHENPPKKVPESKDESSGLEFWQGRALRKCPVTFLAKEQEARWPQAKNQ
jgi:hypothetical protein